MGEEGMEMGEKQHLKSPQLRQSAILGVLLFIVAKYSTLKIYL